MKRFAVFALVVFVFVPAISYAAPVGNIAKVGMLKKLYTQKNGSEWPIGFILESENDIVFDRNIKDQDGDTELRLFGGKAGFVFQDKFTAYTVLGSADFEEEFTDSGNKWKFESDAAFAWAVGGTAILYETEIGSIENTTLRLGIDGRFRDTNLEIGEITLNGTVYKPSDLGVSNLEIDVSEWQIAGETSLQWKNFSPYAGIKYSDVTGDLRATAGGVTISEDLEGDDNVGVFVGLDVLVVKEFVLNVEGRFIDETALTFGGAVRF